MFFEIFVSIMYILIAFGIYGEPINPKGDKVKWFQAAFWPVSTTALLFQCGMKYLTKG